MATHAPRPRLRTVAAGWLAIAAALGGCAIQAESEATVVGPAPDVRLYDGPFDTPDDPDPSWEPDEMVVAELHPVALFDADDALVYIRRPDAATGGSAPYRVLTALLAPTTPDEEAAGLFTAVPVGTRVFDAYPVDPAGQQVAVHLSAEFDVGDTDLEIQRRVQQVACTLLVNASASDASGAASLELVEFHIEGRGQDEVGFVDADGLADCP